MSKTFGLYDGFASERLFETDDPHEMAKVLRRYANDESGLEEMYAVNGSIEMYAEAWLATYDALTPWFEQSRITNPPHRATATP